MIEMAKQNTACMPKSTHSSTIHHPFPNSTHCQAAGRSQEILRCMQRWKLRHLPGPERWVGKKFGNEGWHATRGAEIILPMNKLYIYILYQIIFWVQNLMIPTMVHHPKS